MDQKPAPVSEKQPLVILTTPRLILRAAVEEDISILQNLVFGDGDVMRFAFSGAPMARDAAEDFIRRFFTFGSSLTGFAVLTEKPAGEIIGLPAWPHVARSEPTILKSGLSLRAGHGAGGLQPKSARRSSPLGSRNSNAADCSGWSIRETCRPVMRSRSSECAIWRRLRTPSAEVAAFM
jgi:hypothetical protein